jgi:hypothetical protein
VVTLQDRDTGAVNKFFPYVGSAMAGMLGKENGPGLLASQMAYYDRMITRARLGTIERSHNPTQTWSETLYWRQSTRAPIDIDRLARTEPGLACCSRVLRVSLVP